MITMNPYLNFDGTTEEAFNFYKSTFGGDFLMLQRFKDIPGGAKMPPEVQNKIMHIALKIGENTLMGTDAIDGMGHKLVVGNNVSLSLQMDNKEETNKIFEKLSNGGTVDLPLEDAFWGAYFGMCTDKFGMKWMLNCETKK